ncbi:hypothetical protein RFI_28495 [Reticulomyxa filosa]|uniref:Uncharacterized protein n=1 Tax=Reticulomyxa filosa TaxID=46433 RepID=X6M620_RETFI|nr:hypothetical protein RFI_28495 [Reticulomyxa filosa]|eukprot:ETO08892.1 hypothetical protein RFI_28495 [Reticulomyxa filosa]
MQYNRATYQREVVAQHRQSLSALYCHFDSGTITQAEFVKRIHALGIQITTAFQNVIEILSQKTKKIFESLLNKNSLQKLKTKLIRRRQDKLKFHDVLQALQSFDEDVNQGASNKREDYSRKYNPDAYKYTHEKDFLQWNSNNLPPLPSLTPTFSSLPTATCNAGSNSNTTEYVPSYTQYTSRPNSSCYRSGTSARTNIYQKIGDDEELRGVFKNYSEGHVSFGQLENEIKLRYTTLNPAQERILAECRANGSNVSLSQLYLAFSKPRKQEIGNFSNSEALEAQRQPVVFVNDGSDIIAWSKRDEDIENVNSLNQKPPPISTTQHPVVDEKYQNSIITPSYFKQTTSLSKKGYVQANKSFQSSIVFSDCIMPNPSASITEKSQPSFNVAQAKPVSNILQWNETNASLSNSNQMRDEVKKCSDLSNLIVKPQLLNLTYFQNFGKGLSFEIFFFRFERDHHNFRRLTDYAIKSVYLQITNLMHISQVLQCFADQHIFTIENKPFDTTFN